MHFITSIVVAFAFLHSLDGQKQEVSRLNFFDTDLLRYAAEERKGNVVVSPASIKSVLAMLLEGARGTTAQEIRSALRLSANKDEFREQLNLYLSALQSNNTKGVVLQNANAVFASNIIRLNKEYEKMLQRVYMTEVCRVNFRDPAPAAELINDWVNSHTHGLIPAVIEPASINPLTEILLVNALYFRSAWQHSFEPRSTRAGCFHHAGLCRTVAMMELHAELNYAYVDNLRAHAVELPYEGGRYSMVLLVPQEREGLAAMVRDLPYMSLPQVTHLFESSDVTLMLPKFTVDYSEDMIGSLKSMRIASLFSSKANLTGMFEGNAQINNIFHRVLVAVDEHGTVAAAAAAAVVVPLIQDGVQIRVDRPFVFFITDNKEGLVLFEGKIEEPTPYMEQNGIKGLTTTKNGGDSIKRSFG